MSDYVRKIGSVKKTLVDEDFDFYYDFFKNKAERKTPHVAIFI